MLSIAIGGKLFDLLQASPVTSELIAVATGSVATLSLAVTTVSWTHSLDLCLNGLYGGADARCWYAVFQVQTEFSWVLAGFVLFEVGVIME